MTTLLTLILAIAMNTPATSIHSAPHQRIEPTAASAQPDVIIHGIDVDDMALAKVASLS